MTFPPNNLPSDSKYWVREVEKKLVNLENSFRSAEINNVTRDSQLGVTATSALSAASTAQTSLDAVVSLSESGSGYTINADNINAGTIDAINITGSTITGSTLSTKSSGQRVQLTSSQADFYNTNGVLGGSIKGYINNGWDAVEINSPSIVLRSTGYQTFIDGDVGIYTGDLTVEGGITTTGGANSVSTNTLNLNGASFTKNAGGQMEGPGFRATGDVNVVGNIFYAADTGTGDIAYFSGNQIVKATSSARYKQQIEDMPVLDEILTMPLRTFKYNTEVERDGENAPKLYGYIAEELHELGLTDFVTYEEQEDGTILPNGVRQISILTALHRVVQEQDKTIKSLEARIEALEAK